MRAVNGTRPRERESHASSPAGAMTRTTRRHRKTAPRSRSPLQRLQWTATSSTQCGLRRQLDRWGHCSRDAVLCVISPTEADDAYDKHGQLGRGVPISLWDHGVRCLRLIDIAQALFGKHKHAAAIDAAIRPGSDERALESRSESARSRLVAEQQAAKMAAARWMAGSTRSQWLLQLPADVLAHSVLGFLDFEQLMGVRAVSRSMQSACERVACAWMNRTFPAGLQQLVDVQQQPRVVDAQSQAVTGKKKSRRKRMRESEEGDEQDGAADGRGPSAQDGVSSSPSDRLSSSSSSPSWSPSSSRTAPSATAAVSGASFDMSDCVWTLRQLLWAQRVHYEAMLERHEPGASYRSTISGPAALQRFCLRATQLPASAQRVADASDGRKKKKKPGGPDKHERYDILPVMHAALGAHGHVGVIVGLRARRAGVAAKRVCTSELRCEALVKEVDAAFAQAGATCERKLVMGRSVSITTRVHQFTWRLGTGWDGCFRWGPQPLRLHESAQQRTEFHEQGVRVHAAMRALGWQCDGHCGWGECRPLQDGLLTAEQLVGKKRDGKIHWSESDGSWWYAYRGRVGVWIAHKMP